MMHILFTMIESGAQLDTTNHITLRLIMKLIQSSLIAFAIFFAGTASAAHFVIEEGHSSIQTQFKHVGISWLRGQFKSFSGSLEYDPENVSASSVTVDIDTASIDSNHATRDEHMREPRHLDTEQYPTAKFVSTSVVDKGDGKMTINGNFTLRGVSKEIAIEATIAGEGETRWSDYRMGLEGTTTIDMRDFGVESFGPTHQVEIAMFLEVIRE